MGSASRWQFFLIAAVPLAMLLGCWNADFFGFDDRDHLDIDPQAQVPWSNLLSTYNLVFPVQRMSYEADRALFASWMPGAFGSWAPGVRFMNYVYHAGAALILWRVLLLLRLSEKQSFFIALLFACHPLGCESVCWISERKNVLAGFFGFASLWAWLRFRSRGWIFALPAAGFYLLALFSKISALGLLPVFAVIEAFGGAEGIAGTQPMCWRPGAKWAESFMRLFPIGVVSIVVLLTTVKADLTIPPPGGSIFTAALTDLEIIVRYLGNIAFPLWLSAIYYVKPVESLFDTRVIGYGFVLAGIVAATIRLSSNRRRSVFGWLWFLGALGPNLNLVANPFLMQDRYIYLGTPGILIVIVEAVSGLSSQLGAFKNPRYAAAAYILFLTMLSATRGYLWRDDLTLFLDATQLQPQASFAHYCVGKEYLARQASSPDPGMHQKGIEELQLAIQCPDATRNPMSYYDTALELADEYWSHHDAVNAEKYWRLTALAPPDPPGAPKNARQGRAIAFQWLSQLKLEQGKYSEAYEFADQAVKLHDTPNERLSRARAALKLAEQPSINSDERKRAHDSARADILSVPADSRFHAQAAALLKGL